MAQSKLNDLAGKFGKGGPPGLGIGLKLLGAAGALFYAATQSVYTGNLPNFSDTKNNENTQEMFIPIGICKHNLKKKINIFLHDSISQ